MIITYFVSHFWSLLGLNFFLRLLYCFFIYPQHSSLPRSTFTHYNFFVICASANYTTFAYCTVVCDGIILFFFVLPWCHRRTLLMLTNFWWIFCFNTFWEFYKWVRRRIVIINFLYIFHCWITLIIFLRHRTILTSWCLVIIRITLFHSCCSYIFFV